MNINSNEIMLLRRSNANMVNTMKDTPSPVTEPETSSPATGMKALEIAANNNIAFQGVKFSNLKNLPKYLLLAGAMAAGAATTTSCEGLFGPTKVENEYTYIDIDLSGLLEAYQKNNEISQELLNEIKALRGDIANIYNLLLSYGLKMDQAIELLVASGHNQEAILDAVTKGNEEFKGYLTTIVDNTDYLKGIKENTDSLVVLSTETRDAVNNLITIYSQNAEKESQDSKIMKETVIKMAKMFAIYVRGEMIMDKKQLEMLQDLTKAMLENNTQNAAFFAWLVDNYGSLEETVQNGFDKVLEGMEEGKTFNQKFLDLMTTGYDKMCEMAGDNKAFYDLVISKMDLLNESGQAGVAKLLEQMIAGDEIDKQILEVANKGLTHLFKMSDVQKDFFNAALEKMDQLETAGKNGVAELISHIVKNNEIGVAILKAATEGFAKLDDMTAAQKEFFNNVLEKFSQLENSTKDGVTKLLEKMDELKTETLVYAKALLEHHDTLGEKADKLLELFSKLPSNPSSGEKVDLSKLEDGMNTLIELYKNNSDKLDGVNDNISGLKAMVKAFADNVSDDNKDIKFWLYEIYNIMPADHVCDHSKLEQLAKDILEAVEDNKTDETIKGDLNDILG